ncbi:MAG: hypothetical protein ACLP1Y_03905 [Candidatus Acidiferrales bacterium]
MTQTDLKTIREIEALMRSSEPIPASRVKAWMSCPSIDVQGALTTLMLEHSPRIEPPLSWDEICSALQSYYGKCLLQGVRDSDYAPNRHIAGHDLANWFKRLWNDPSVPRVHLLRLKEMLRELYLHNEGLRNAIVTAVVEHLFETPQIQEFFADWKSDPILARAFDLAKEWGDDHPSDSQS